MLNCSTKACEICPSQRIRIGETYHLVGPIRRFFGVLFIHLPVVFFPVILLIMFMTVLSLKLLGAKNLKRYRDFVPANSSHRYSFSKQVVMEQNGLHAHLGWKIFWQFNCSYYCPYSVALFEYMAYLVKAVENWWCPFYHERKPEYANAPIDSSYWHVSPGAVDKLHPDDSKNPIWKE